MIKVTQNITIQKYKQIYKSCRITSPELIIKLSQILLEFFTASSMLRTNHFIFHSSILVILHQTVSLVLSYKYHIVVIFNNFYIQTGSVSFICSSLMITAPHQLTIYWWIPMQFRVKFKDAFICFFVILIRIMNPLSRKFVNQPSHTHTYRRHQEPKIHRSLV